MLSYNKLLLASGLVFPLTAIAASPMETCRYHFIHGQYDLAVQPCTKVADQGNLDAQKWLGLIFTKGKVVPRDYYQAFKWKLLAARQGDATGELTVGRMYEQGLGVQQDYHQAVMWYRKSVAQGNADAQYSLGSMYRKGAGVPQDTIQAWAWYSLAAEQGMYLAIEQRDRLGSMFSDKELARAKQVAAAFKADTSF